MAPRRSRAESAPTDTIPAIDTPAEAPLDTPAPPEDAPAPGPAPVPPGEPDGVPSADPCDVGAPLAGYRVELVRGDWVCERLLDGVLAEGGRTAHVSFARADSEGRAWLRKHVAWFVV